MRLRQGCQAVKSTVKDLAKLRLYPLPRTPTPVALTVTQGTTVVMVSPKGRIYTSQANPSYTYWSSVKRMSETIACLVRLGVLTDEMIEQHKAAEQIEYDANERHMAANNLVIYAATLGVALSAAQLRAVRAAQPKAPTQ